MFSPFSSEPFQLLDEGTALDAAAIEHLRHAPCPTIAVARADTPLSQACDVVVADLEQAQPLIDNIRRCPIAATALVQVLRATESLSIEDGLLVESLAYSTLQAGPEFRRWLDQQKPVRALAAEDGPAVLLLRDDDRLQMQLNRPANHNAMSVEMRDALIEALELVLADDTIKRVQISGRGKCFSTGGNLAEFGTAPDPATAHIIRGLALPGRLLAACAGRVEVSLHGACVGSGIEFPALASRIVAREDAWFQLPELKFGLIPGAGGCISIARRIGRQRTAWLALSGKRINAASALQWGLVDALA